MCMNSNMVDIYDIVLSNYWMVLFFVVLDSFEMLYVYFVVVFDVNLVCYYNFFFKFLLYDDLVVVVWVDWGIFDDDIIEM